jgi:hypothetical protein
VAHRRAFPSLSACSIIAIASALALATSAAAPAAEGVPTSSEARKQAWISEAAEGLDPRAIEALQRIDGSDRRLLALRAYLRAGDSLAERWSWSGQQLAGYASTPEGRTAAANIDAVTAAFTAANPGFTLQVNRQPRSLELQLAHWNANASVAAVAATLSRSLERRFADRSTEASAPELRAALVEWKPAVAATLAAPGLSPHGQGRAFDFQITHHGRVIAGVEATTARQSWDSPGWTQKLHAAVSAAGNHFVGPLQSPYEPWHYAYTPEPSSGAAP